MVKPDNFKAINDTFGHEAGDKALMLLADMVKSRLRDGELGARYRGDEYCVILPGCAPREAAAAAEALRAAVRAIEYQGASYQVSLDRPGAGELMAVVSDEQFADEPLNIGDNVSVLWADKDIHALAPAT